MSRVVIIGANGTTGRAVTDLLAKDHEVVRVGNTSGEFQVDLSSTDSIDKMFAAVGRFDALVSAAGLAQMGKVNEISDEDLNLSVQNKLLGQVHLVRRGLEYAADNGSFTLSGGLFGRQPWPGTVAIATVNAGLEGFARAAALDLPRGLRVNVVSPILVTESAVMWGMSTEGTMSAAQTALAYKASVAGTMTGENLDVRDYV